MESKNLFYFLYVSASLWLISPDTATATGPIQGAKNTGMGTAFVAVADDPSAIAVNPAGLTQLKGTNIYGGISLMIPSTTYMSPSGEEEKTDSQVFFPPHAYISSDMGTRHIQLGLGIYSLYGIGGRKWDEHGLTRYITTKSLIGSISVNPTLAYRVSPVLSIGVGIDYMYSTCDSEAMVNQSLLGASDGRLSVEGKGDGWGYNLGILYAPGQKFSFGVAYRSRIKVEYHGTVRLDNIAPALQPLFGGAEFTTDAKTTLTFPDILSLGIAYRPSEKLTLAFDAEYMRWSSFKRTDLDIDHEIPAANFTNISTPHDWKNSWLIKFGGDYKVNEKLSLRAGYVYVESPVPDHTLDPVNPESTQHNINIGFGYTMNTYTLDFFYTMRGSRKTGKSIIPS